MAETLKPLTIVIGCDTFPPDINGEARFAERLASGLAERGHEIHIIAPSVNNRYGTYREIHNGVPMIVHRLKSYRLPQHKTLRFVWPFTLQRRTDTLLAAIAPDVVHIQSHLVVGRYLSKSALSQGIRLIATNHTMPENLIRYSIFIPGFAEQLAMRWAWADAAKILKRASVITTPTRKAADILESNTNIRGVLAISCGIDAKEFAHAAKVSNAHPRALFVGRLDYEKHIHVLIEAFAALPKSLNAQLELVGDGGERASLERWVDELKVKDRVTFMGHVDEAELRRAYERATVFVMPSIAELQSIATMEAMASGRPVIGANAAALPHLIHDGENGYLFEPEDVATLTLRLTQVFQAKPAELNRLANNSLHFIKSHDIGRTLDIFENIYRGLDSGADASDDNLAEYSAPIRVTEASLEQIRVAAKAFRDAAQGLRDGVLERLSDVRGEVVERFEEIGFEVSTRRSKARKRVEKTIDKALERFRRHDR